MHEDLLGYLLGALEPHEMHRIETMLREDPSVRQQLAEVERSLRPLEGQLEPPEPIPEDLVQRTLDSLPPLPAKHVSREASDPMDSLFVAEQSSDSSFSELQAMSPELKRSGRVRLNGMDWAAIALAGAIVLTLMVPSILRERSAARQMVCQNQLREIGVAIMQYVDRSEQNRLPAVAPSGPEAFAGMYAVRLNNEGLMEDPSIRWCPSLDAPGSKRLRFQELNELPSYQELREAPIEQLVRFQRYGGGHYAYNLGVVDENEFAPPKFESRSSFAVLSDAALTSNLDTQNLDHSIGHGGRGINVLYEDGRVQFVALSSLGAMPDHPLINHRGEVEAGVNIDDAALAPSWRPPFVDVRQR